VFSNQKITGLLALTPGLGLPDMRTITANQHQHRIDTAIASAVSSEPSFF
jgi:hypothetical protein